MSPDYHGPAHQRDDATQNSNGEILSCTPGTGTMQMRGRPARHPAVRTRMYCRGFAWTAAAEAGSPPNHLPSLPVSTRPAGRHVCSVPYFPPPMPAEKISCCTGDLFRGPLHISCVQQWQYPVRYLRGSADSRVILLTGCKPFGSFLQFMQGGLVCRPCRIGLFPCVFVCDTLEQYRPGCAANGSVKRHRGVTAYVSNTGILLLL